MTIIPELRTEHFTLRRIKSEDVEFLYSYWSNPVITEYMNVCIHDIEETLQMMDFLNSLAETGEGTRWAITLNPTGRVIGSCGYHNLKAEHGRAEIGYELGREFWGQGVIQEVMQAVLNYCFGTLGLNRIEAFVTEGNMRSLGSLKKLGFKPEGLLRDYEFYQGKFKNQIILSILRVEWERGDLQQSYRYRSTDAQASPSDRGRR